MLPMTQLLGAVPVVGIALGACAGLARCASLGAPADHDSRQSQVFAGGPPVVKQALGLTSTRRRWALRRDAPYSGVVGLAVDTEEGCRRRGAFVATPSNVWEQRRG
jgi:hypothetical protein